MYKSSGTLRSARHGTEEVAVKLVEARSSSLCCFVPHVGSQVNQITCLSKAYSTTWPAFPGILLLPADKSQGRDHRSFSPVFPALDSLGKEGFKGLGVFPLQVNKSSIFFLVKTSSLCKRILFL